MKDILKRTKKYIYENRHFISATVLSALAIIAIIIVISLLKGNNNTIASGGEIYSDSETTSPDIETASDNFLQNNETSIEDETSGLSDIDFTLPEDSTDETESTLPADKYPYLLKVNRIQNCVTVYTKDANGNFTVPYKAMACSTGKIMSNTPLGTFKISSRYTWRLMVDGTHSQYATRFNGGILFHSVPCYSPNKDQLEYEEFNKLGSPASLGCVRLTVKDSKWIYDNCPSGTTVVVYDDATSPGPLGKPSVIKIPADSPYKGWDPTDPDSANPWNSCSPSIDAKDMTVTANSNVNLLSMITAKDTCGNDVTSTVTISGDYNLNIPGSYTVTFSVIDLLGRSASRTITLKVTGSGVNTNTAGTTATTTKPANNNNNSNNNNKPSETTTKPVETTTAESSSTITETDSSQETTEADSETTLPDTDISTEHQP